MSLILYVHSVIPWWSAQFRTEYNPHLLLMIRSVVWTTGEKPETIRTLRRVAWVKW